MNVIPNSFLDMQRLREGVADKEDDAEGEVDREILTMEDLNAKFIMNLDENFPGLGEDLFVKINDALKLQPFLESRNGLRFKRFYKEFIVEENNASIGNGIDDFITELAEDWVRDDMLGWNIKEKMKFLEYAWTCKEFRSKMQKKRSVEGLQSNVKCAKRQKNRQRRVDVLDMAREEN
jgi:hypothetical protein